jgi:hypothetical protein
MAYEPRGIVWQSMQAHAARSAIAWAVLSQRSSNQPAGKRSESHPPSGPATCKPGSNAVLNVIPVFPELKRPIVYKGAQGN